MTGQQAPAVIARLRRSTLAAVILPLSILLLSALFVGWNITALYKTPLDSPPGTPVDQLFNATRAFDDLIYITRDRHSVDNPAIERVRTYIVDSVRNITAHLKHKQEVEIDLDNHDYLHTGRDFMTEGPVEVYLIESANILVRLKGEDSKRDAFMLTAHYDSASLSHGASDAGVGVVVMLEALRQFVLHRPKHDLIFNFDCGEEDGLLGAKAFIGHKWFTDVRAYIDLEGGGVGGPAMIFRGRGLPLYSEFARRQNTATLVSGLGTDLLRVVPSGSDMSVYDAAGIPGIDHAFIHPRAWYHTKNDNAGLTGPHAVASMGHAAMAIARGAVDSDWLPNIPRSPTVNLTGSASLTKPPPGGMIDPENDPWRTQLYTYDLLGRWSIVNTFGVQIGIYILLVTLSVVLVVYGGGSAYFSTLQRQAFALLSVEEDDTIDVGSSSNDNGAETATAATPTATNTEQQQQQQQQHATSNPTAAVAAAAPAATSHSNNSDGLSSTRTSILHLSFANSVAAPLTRLLVAILLASLCALLLCLILGIAVIYVNPLVVHAHPILFMSVFQFAAIAAILGVIEGPFAAIEIRRAESHSLTAFSKDSTPPPFIRRISEVATVGPLADPARRRRWLWYALPLVWATLNIAVGLSTTLAEFGYFYRLPWYLGASVIGAICTAFSDDQVLGPFRYKTISSLVAVAHKYNLRRRVENAAGTTSTVSDPSLSDSSVVSASSSDEDDEDITGESTEHQPQQPQPQQPQPQQINSTGLPVTIPREDEDAISPVPATSTATAVNVDDGDETTPLVPKSRRGRRHNHGFHGKHRHFHGESSGWNTLTDYIQFVLSVVRLFAATLFPLVFLMQSTYFVVLALHQAVQDGTPAFLLVLVGAIDAVWFALILLPHLPVALARHVPKHFMHRSRLENPTNALAGVILKPFTWFIRSDDTSCERPTEPAAANEEGRRHCGGGGGRCRGAKNIHAVRRVAARVSLGVALLWLFIAVILAVANMLVAPFDNKMGQMKVNVRLSSETDMLDMINGHQPLPEVTVTASAIDGARLKTAISQVPSIVQNGVKCEKRSNGFHKCEYKLRDYSHAINSDVQHIAPPKAELLIYNQTLVKMSPATAASAKSMEPGDVTDMYSVVAEGMIVADGSRHCLLDIDDKFFLAAGGDGIVSSNGTEYSLYVQRAFFLSEHIDDKLMDKLLLQPGDLAYRSPKVQLRTAESVAMFRIEYIIAKPAQDGNNGGDDAIVSKRVDGNNDDDDVPDVQLPFKAICGFAGQVPPTSVAIDEIYDVLPDWALLQSGWNIYSVTVNASV
ncbi:hypothetical protein GQ42DRAFT_164182 [Ramicandelaber brevisporus]|nr:hypothetical protein GQ42DRAFT_165245 [Ramicandelaber brevisporus]KAI8868366.1 hypothetical protein GQ42DRAFT_164182 [Ramicandelaber brevisporus]